MSQTPSSLLSESIPVNIGCADDSVRHTSLSLSSSAQILLTALQAVIIPLIKVVLPKSEGLGDVEPGPEAEDFLVALQKYISSVVQEQLKVEQHSQMTRVVDLGDAAFSPSVEALDTGVGQHAIAGSPSAEPVQAGKSMHMVTTNPHLERNPLQAEALANLRAKVFNEMPIRLLSFQKYGSQLNITLMDRPQIYAFLETKLLEREGNQNRASEASSIAEYAILSHTWIRSASAEVSYNDWQKGSFDLSHAGYHKLVNFCRIAMEKHGLAFGWMDTVCIDKNSSTELDESIRSMYKWYQHAKICVTYLAETNSLAEMQNDAWFTRGWTLQELLAPWGIKFYGRNWKQLVASSFTDKIDANILRKIEAATTITKNELLSYNIVPISRRMEWAAERTVTRGEDHAYSLMGIFGINMSTAYGEGAELAFLRLSKEILSTFKSGVLDLFNWGGHVSREWTSEKYTPALLPPGPKFYLQRKNINYPPALIEPLLLTHVGLRVPVLILPVAQNLHSGTEYESIGIYYAAISIDTSLHTPTMHTYSFNVLDSRVFRPTFDDVPRYAFAVLNCGGDTDIINVPKNCFAVAFHYRGDVLVTPITNKQMIDTRYPITFALNSKVRHSDKIEDSYSIKRSELKLHMMQFLSMYF
ncbi:hypothetical protein BDN70DRAFT_884288 [Pholiota conissans]|uniref:Heterokaryon incompatibility domain-containing protein n=1 Tax=Pholiota conissans TaxID=109636 RepID=A0A9P5YSB8_9AGAR|nr:hypothetical protein BDN70DRAFT_884288 [Pholiota conissans]